MIIISVKPHEVPESAGFSTPQRSKCLQGNPRALEPNSGSEDSRSPNADRATVHEGFYTYNKEPPQQYR